MKKIFEILFGTVIFVGFLVLLVVFLFLFQPGLLINNWTYHHAVKWAHVDLIDKGSAVSAKAVSWRKKELNFSFTGICFGKKPDAEISFCADHLSFRMVFNLERPLVRIYEIGPVEWQGGFLKVDISKPSLPKAKSSFDLKILLPKKIDELVLGKLHLQVPQWSVKTSAGVFRGFLNLSGESQNKMFLWSGLTRFSAPKLEKSEVGVTGSFKFPDTLKVRVLGKEICPDVAQISGCLDAVEVGLKANWNPDFHIVELSPLHFASQSLEIDLPQGKTTNQLNAPSSKSNAFTFPPLPHFLIDDIALHFPKLALALGDDRYSGKLETISLGLRGNAVRIKLDVSEKAKKLEGHINTVLVYGVEPKTKGAVTLEFSQQRFKSDFDVAIHKDSLVYDLDAQGLLGANATISLKAKGDWVGHRLLATLKSEVHYHQWNISSLHNCELAIHDDDESQFGCTLQANVPQNSQFKYLPEEVLVHLVLHGKSLNQAQASVRLDPVKNELLLIRADLEAQTHAPPEVTLNGENLFDFLDVRDSVEVKLLDFKKLVEATYGTSLAPPAPFNTLLGSVTLSSRGKLVANESEIPFTLQTALKSVDQSFLMYATGTLGAKKIGKRTVPDLEATALLDSIALVLPKLKYSKPPPVLPDPRIRKTLVPVNATNTLAKAGATPGSAVSGGLSGPLSFYYNISLVTPTGHPILLVSNLAKAPIPIALNLKIQAGEGLRGDFKVQEFPVELFRRNAKVLYFNYGLKSDRSDENPISGDFLLAFSDYNVHIILSGTAKTPVVKLESDPPLPENQILAVVLFGKSPDALDSDQNSSVGNMQAALQDRALALSSLFLLASTPIESVGYDAQQKMFTAKVKLADGVSLDIGSGSSDLKEIGINKRLGNSWYIRAFVSNPTDSQDQSVTAFLEKLFRY